MWAILFGVERDGFKIIKIGNFLLEDKLEGYSSSRIYCRGKKESAIKQEGTDHIV